MKCCCLLLVWIRMVCVAVVQDEGLTALHEAAGSGHVDVVKALLAAGAGVTARDVRGDLASVGTGAGSIGVSVEWSGRLHGVRECSW